MQGTLDVPQPNVGLGYRDESLAARAWWQRAKRKAMPERRQRLVVVGNGMVGHRLLERLVEAGATERYEIVVLGEEALPAYDRVHLTEVLRGRPSRSLLLRDTTWHTEQGIELRLGARVSGIDRTARVVHTERGDAVPYDELVLATGSSARVPSITVDDERSVLLYRTVEDAELIAEHALESRRSARPVAVIGGGLLGLEAARTLQLLGCRVIVLEASSQVLPKQLDATAAEELSAILSEAGIELRTKVRIERIERMPGGARICLQGAPPLEVGVAVCAAGARPQDDLARSAGLRCDARGGVVVDSRLRTSDPRIYAIGECAHHPDVPHGLVAPGYAMADALSARLMGGRQRMAAQAAVTRLKLDLTEVTVFGNPLASSGGTEIAYRAPGCYRRLVVGRNQRILAAVCVGSWSELSALQRAIATGSRVSREALAKFRREGALGLEPRRLGVVGWPDAAVVCQCAGVTCGSLRGAIRAGHETPEALARATGASTLCGSCRGLLCELTNTESAGAPVPYKALAIASTLAVVGVLVTLLVPRVALPGTIAARSLEVLWLAPVWKQATGFGVLGLLVAGLGLSLRKRFPALKLGGSPAAWQTIHAALGAGALAAVFLHTGFRLGENLNLWLMLCLLGASITGGATGALQAMLRRGTAAATIRTWSSRLRRVHEVVFWALPVLVLLHVFKIYYY